MVDRNVVTAELRLRDMATAEVNTFIGAMRRAGRETKGAGKDADRARDQFGRFARDGKRGTKELGDELKRARTQSSGLFTSILKGAVVIGTFRAAVRTVRRLREEIVRLVQSSSGFEEDFSKFLVVFGDEAEAAGERIDDISLRLGRSGANVTAYASRFQGLLTALGLTREEASGLSTGLAELGLDLASFNNTADAEALKRISSALVGELEAVRRFGVDLAEATVQGEAYRLGLVGIGEELTQVQKVQARASLLFKQTTDAQGDAERTFDSFENTMKRIVDASTDLAVVYGGELKESILQQIEDLGGVEKVLALVEVGYGALVGTGTAVIDVISSIASGALEMIDALGGTEEVAALFAGSFDSATLSAGLFDVAVGQLPATLLTVLQGMAELALAGGLDIGGAIARGVSEGAVDIGSELPGFAGEFFSKLGDEADAAKQRTADLRAVAALAIADIEESNAALERLAELSGRPIQGNFNQREEVIRPLFAPSAERVADEIADLAATAREALARESIDVGELLLKKPAAATRAVSLTPDLDQILDLDGLNTNLSRASGRVVNDVGVQLSQLASDLEKVITESVTPLEALSIKEEVQEALGIDNLSAGNLIRLGIELTTTQPETALSRLKAGAAESEARIASLADTVGAFTESSFRAFDAQAQALQRYGAEAGFSQDAIAAATLGTSEALEAVEKKLEAEAVLLRKRAEAALSAGEIGVAQRDRELAAIELVLAASREEIALRRDAAQASSDADEIFLANAAAIQAARRSAQDSLAAEVDLIRSRFAAIIEGAEEAVTALERLGQGDTDQAAEIREQIDALRTLRDTEIETAEAAARRQEIQRATEAREEVAALSLEVRGGLEAELTLIQATTAARREAVIAALEAQAISSDEADKLLELLDKLQAKQEELAKANFTAGASEAVEAGIQQIGQASTAAAAVTDGFSALESGVDGYARALVEGRGSFAEFRDGLLKDLAVITARTLFLRGLFALLGLGSGLGGGGGSDLPTGFLGGSQTEFAKGGVKKGKLQGTIPLKKYASGGIARGPQLAIFGEVPGLAEAFVPLPDGSNIPVTIKMDGASREVGFDPSQIPAEFMTEATAAIRSIGQAILGVPVQLREMALASGGIRSALADFPPELVRGLRALPGFRPSDTAGLPETAERAPEAPPRPGELPPGALGGAGTPPGLVPEPSLAALGLEGAGLTVDLVSALRESGAGQAAALQRLSEVVSNLEGQYGSLSVSIDARGADREGVQDAIDRSLPKFERAVTGRLARGTNGRLVAAVRDVANR